MFIWRVKSDFKITAVQGVWGPLFYIVFFSVKGAWPLYMDLGFRV